MVDESKDGMITKSKEWFNEQTMLVKKLTIWLGFFIALFTIWGSLKLLGVQGLDWFIGCSSYGNQTEQNAKDISTIKTTDSVNRFWKEQRRIKDSATNDKRFRRIESKLHLEIFGQ